MVAHRIPSGASGSPLISRRQLVNGALAAVGGVAALTLTACGGSVTATSGGATSSAATVSRSVARTTATTSALVSSAAASAVTTSAPVAVAASTKAAVLGGKIRFSYTGGPPMDAVYGKLTSTFNANHPGAQVAATGDWNWDNNKYIVQASGGDAADVVWTSETFNTQLWIAGVTHTLDSFIATDAQFKPGDYFDTVIKAYQYQGKQIGLPMLWGAYVMYYNKSLFDKAGQQYPDAAWTWDKLLSAAKALTQPAGDPSVLGQYGFETRNHQNVWSQWIWGDGGQLFSADGRTCTMGTPEAIAGIQHWLDLVYKDQVAPTPKALSANKLSDAFHTGKTAMIWNAIYFLPTYRKNPSLDFDVAPIPMGPKAHQTTLPTDGLDMWKGTRDADLAWAFMKYLVSEESQKALWIGGVGGLPVQKAAAQLLLTDPGKPQHKQVYIDAFAYAKPAFTDPYGQNAIDVLQKQGKFGDMWQNNLPAQSVLTAAMPLVNKAIQDQIKATPVAK